MDDTISLGLQTAQPGGWPLTQKLDASPGFNLVARALADALLILDSEETVVYVGEGGEAVLGAAPGDVLGRPFRDLVRPADLVGLPPRICQSGGPWEVRFETGEGDRWMSVAAASPPGLRGPGAEGDVLKDLEGHVLLFVRDVGHDRVARDRSDLYRRALDATNNLVVVSDARQEDRPIVFVNEHFLDVTGYSREEVIGRNCRFLQVRPDGTRDDDQDGVRQLRQSVAAGEAVHVLLRNYTKDGRLFWNDLFVTPIVNADGEITHFAGVQNDVTDRAEAQAERRQLEITQVERTAALEQAADAIVITDGSLDWPGPKIRYVNRAFEEMTGRSRHEVLGQNPRFMQGALTDRTELDRLRRELSAGRPYRGELINVRKDGTPYVFEAEIAPIRGLRGEVVGFVSTQRDVTARRRLESEVLAAATRAQEQIARDLHDGVGQLLAGTAYHLHSLARDLRAEGSVHAEAAARAAQLVQDAQRQSRALAHGLFPLHVAGGGLSDELRRLAEETAATYGLACRFECPSPVAMEPEREVDLYRIAQEAVANAVRHGSPTAIHLRLRASADAGGEGLAHLSVEDDGVGISDEALEDGGGLGLNTMRYRARRLGGSVEIRRRPQGGTAIQVNVPRRARTVLEKEAGGARAA